MKTNMFFRFCCYAGLLIFLQVPMVIAEDDPVKPDPNVKTILIKVDPGASCGNEAASLGFGIPLREGQAKNLNELSVADGKNMPVPAEFEVRTSWDDGSIQWLWTDFRGQPGNRYYLKIGGARKTPKGKLTVQSKNDEIVVNNGIQEWVWNKQSATPVRLSMVTGSSAKPVFQVARGDGIYLIDQKNQRAALAGQKAELEWKIETANSLRAVVRAEGWYVTDQGEKIARAIVRYHLYWNDPSVRVEHRFIVTRDNDETWYKEVGIRFPLAGEKGVKDKEGTWHKKVIAFLLSGEESAEAVLAKKDGVYTANLGGEDEVFMCQMNYPVYNRLNEYRCVIGKRKGRGEARELEDCKVAGGWASVGNHEAVLAMAMKDFAEQFPKEFSASAGGLTLKLWSGRDGKALDYKPATMAKDWWKDWLKRLEYSSIDAKWFADNGGITVENVLSGKFNPSCVGVSRVHEFYVSYFPGKTDNQKVQKWAAGSQLPAVAYADPKWITRVDARVLPPMSYNGEGGENFAVLERYISGWYDQYMLPMKVFPMTGWYDWGRTSQQRYEKLEDGTIYAQFFRQELFNNYGLSTHVFYAWLRSGERRYLDIAQRMTRLLSSYRVIQWDGGKDGKKKGYCCYGGGHFPIYWRGAGALSFFRTDDFTGAACLEYYLRDNRFHSDDLKLRAEALEKKYTPTWSNDQGHADRHMMVLMEMYMFTKNPVFKKYAARIFDSYTDLNQPYGINARYYPENEVDYEGPSNKLSRKIMWLTMYADWTREDRARKVALKAFQDGAIGSTVGLGSCYYGNGPDSYKNFMGYVVARFYDWNRDKEMLKYIEWQTTWLKKIWEALEALPPDQRDLNGMISRIHASKKPEAASTMGIKKTGSGAASPRGLIFKEIIVPEQNPKIPYAIMTFGDWNNGVPFLAVPAGIWALNGASYDYPEVKIGE